MVKKIPAPISISMRWGHNVSLKWVFGSYLTAPPANTALVSYTATRRTYIYGFYIFSDEPNDFTIEWTHGGADYEFLIATGSRGTTYFVDIIPLNESLAADPGTQIVIRNKRDGNTGMVYRAALFIGEVVE